MASTYNLEEILHPHVITEAYKEQASAQAKNPLLDFYGKKPKNLSGDRFEFVFRPAVKEPAPANLRGSPARILQPTGLADRHAYLLHAFNEIGLSMDALQMLRNPEDCRLQEKGRDEIHRQMEDFGDRHMIFRAVALAKALSSGHVYVDKDGKILESSSGAVFDVDLQVPAGHKDQLDPGTGDIIATAWDQAGAKILDDLDDIRIQAESENAEEPKHIWLHHTAKRWFRDNTQIKAYVDGGPEAVDAFLRGSFIENMGGYTWHFFSGTYTAADGSTQPFIPLDQAIITPDLGPWFKAVDGSELISKVEGIYQKVDAALRDVVEVFGDFAYVKLLDNPTKLVLRMGTNFIYLFSNPNAVWMPTVDF